MLKLATVLVLAVVLSCVHSVSAKAQPDYFFDSSANKFIVPKTSLQTRGSLHMDTKLVNEFGMNGAPCDENCVAGTYKPKTVGGDKSWTPMLGDAANTELRPVPGSQVVASPPRTFTLDFPPPAPKRGNPAMWDGWDLDPCEKRFHRYPQKLKKCQKKRRKKQKKKKLSLTKKSAGLKDKIRRLKKDGKVAKKVMNRTKKKVKSLQKQAKRLIKAANKLEDAAFGKKSSKKAKVAKKLVKKAKAKLKTARKRQKKVEKRLKKDEKVGKKVVKKLRSKVEKNLQKLKTAIVKVKKNPSQTRKVKAVKIEKKAELEQKLATVAEKAESRVSKALNKAKKVVTPVTNGKMKKKMKKKSKKKSKQKSKKSKKKSKKSKKKSKKSKKKSIKKKKNKGGEPAEMNETASRTSKQMLRWKNPADVRHCDDPKGCSPKKKKKKKKTTKKTEENPPRLAETSNVNLQMAPEQQPVSVDLVPLKRSREFPVTVLPFSFRESLQQQAKTWTAVKTVTSLKGDDDDDDDDDDSEAPDEYNDPNSNGSPEDKLVGAGGTHKLPAIFLPDNVKYGAKMFPDHWQALSVHRPVQQILYKHLDYPWLTPTPYYYPGTTPIPAIPAHTKGAYAVNPTTLRPWNSIPSDTVPAWFPSRPEPLDSPAVADLQRPGDFYEDPIPKSYHLSSQGLAYLHKNVLPTEERIREIEQQQARIGLSPTATKSALFYGTHLKGDHGLFQALAGHMISQNQQKPVQLQQQPQKNKGKAAPAITNQKMNKPGTKSFTKNVTPKIEKSDDDDEDE